ncbi:hypothetical protein GCM10009828_084590 [Actinoplanes couchii]|uniref:Uncharacterized protein n=1 Tax=Actinoplanes couchii TaxID=403638 RepID=A0ABQ3XNN6_9ACTN|nr:hypothetical protein Aco03nite_084840 [Actinoplanes couchii]
MGLAERRRATPIADQPCLVAGNGDTAVKAFDQASRPADHPSRPAEDTGSPRPKSRENAAFQPPGPVALFGVTRSVAVTVGCAAASRAWGRLRGLEITMVPAMTLLNGFEWSEHVTHRSGKGRR